MIILSGTPFREPPRLTVYITPRSPLPHLCHELVGGVDLLCQQGEVDERCRIGVQSGELGRGRGVKDDGCLESAFLQLAQMGLRAEVAGHAAHHYLVHPTLAELKNQVIVFRPVQFVGCRDDDIRG